MIPLEKNKMARIVAIANTHAKKILRELCGPLRLCLARRISGREVFLEKYFRESLSKRLPPGGIAIIKTKR